MPFEQYKADQNETKNSHNYCTTILTHDYVTELISYSFTSHKDDSREVSQNDDEQLDKYFTSKSTTKESIICSVKCSHADLFADQQSREHWDKLLQNSRKKKKVLNKRKTFWNQNYINVLPLNRLCMNRQEALDDDINESILTEESSCSNNLEKEEVKCNFVLTSDESESEDSGEIVDESDPMYSRFAVIRNAFHTSEDGVVFHCQKEVSLNYDSLQSIRYILLLFLHLFILSLFHPI